jgi:hypothetical protein
MRTVRGEELRARRLQRGVELADAAAELGVPAKSLRALEWDRPDLIGDEDEAEQIGRRYATLLGLEEPELAPAPVPAAPPAPATERKPALWLPILAALAPVAVIVVVYAVGSTDNGESAPEVDRSASSIVTNPEPGVAVEPPSEMSPAPPAPARSTVNLVIAAEEGGSWVEAHSDSETGPVLFAGTVDTGRQVRLSARKIWLRLGAANNLSLTLNGRPAPTELFGTVDVVVTSQGIQPA